MKNKISDKKRKKNAYKKLFRVLFKMNLRKKLKLKLVKRNLFTMNLLKKKLNIESLKKNQENNKIIINQINPIREKNNYIIRYRRMIIFTTILKI